MIYAGDIVENEPLDKYYDDTSKYDGDNYKVAKYVFEGNRRKVSYLKKYIRLKDSILDIGCANGKLLHSLELEGYTKVNGLELSRKNAIYAKQHYGIKVYNGGIG